MIQLHSDYLVFEVSGGEKIPCSVEDLTIEVLAESIDQIDPQVVHQAAMAVLHYFKDDLGRQNVTLDEFTQALEQVLKGLGFHVKGQTPPATGFADIVDADLSEMADGVGDGLELGFYLRLRTQLRTLLAGAPRVVRFHGLRPCAKRLARVQRWCRRSEQVSDEIVRYLRDCWGAERPQKQCALLVN